ncbi:MAG: Asp-tRNA(Asn)/Glu-tRNA(Gln) amidotransferase subunit GatB [Caldiserica bacterium]|nr:Asp-tRNA(Asn)/Glu-tRNA(Gln) amidotransferase subunit GatB [Caldisericota bacterium]
MSDLVIGIEVHIQLLSSTKMFCGCRNSYGEKPNTNICPVCLGLPGALPTVNNNAYEMGIMTALALNCKINKIAPFYRKNYFYPDLPKGYQITQYATPLGYAGSLRIAGGKEVLINRIHLEEDAGKMFHSGDITTSSSSLVDYNRCGAPLAEIVTEPCMSTPEEASNYLTALRNLVRQIGVCTGNMEEGALRCDVNVSVRNADGSFGTKVEVKNLNSFRSARRALDFEAQRQRDLISKGEKVEAQTRHFNEQTGETSPMRSKEELNDYRYFPEPDLPAPVIDDELINRIAANMPETPVKMADRFKEQYELNDYDVAVLTADRSIAVFFENTVKQGAPAKKACNWITADIAGKLAQDNLSIDDTKLTPANLANLIKLVESGTITNQSAKSILPDVIVGEEPENLAKTRNLMVIADEGAILGIVQAVIAKNPAQVEQYKAGKTNLLAFFTGQCMKESGGKAPTELLKKLLTEELSK